jgi:hypothetical protein
MTAFSELRLIASPQGFAVYDSNKKKLGVLAVDVMIRPGNPPMLSIALPAGNVDVVGNAIFAIVDPASGSPRVVRRIEWADGQATDFPAPEKAKGVVKSESGGNGAADPASSPAEPCGTITGHPVAME